MCELRYRIRKAGPVILLTFLDLLEMLRAYQWYDATRYNLVKRAAILSP